MGPSAFESLSPHLVFYLHPRNLHTHRHQPNCLTNRHKRANKTRDINLGGPRPDFVAEKSGQASRGITLLARAALTLRRGGSAVPRGAVRFEPETWFQWKTGLVCLSNKDSPLASAPVFSLRQAPGRSLFHFQEARTLNELFRGVHAVSG